MAETVRSLADIITLLADNNAGAIAPVDHRDQVVSTFGLFGEMRVEAGAAAQSSIGTSPVKMTGWNTDSAVTNTDAFTVDSTTDKDIETLQAGVLDVDVNISFTGTASATFRFEVYLDGVATGIACERTMSGTPVTGSVSMKGKIAVSANQLVTVYVKADAASKSITPSEAQCCVSRVA